MKPALRIGLEVHLQLAAQQKLFCACAPVEDASPNTVTCPVCLGLPGALPTVSSDVILIAVRALGVLGLPVARVSAFDRKHYRSPDLPKGYQMTQQDRPLCTGGAVEGVRVQRVHLEEDAARTVRLEGQRGLDFNRAGVALLELVTAPEFRSGAQATTWLRRVRNDLAHSRVCHGRMERGELRCDVNVSLDRRDGGLGTRVEIKNLNSFRAIRRAVDFEFHRQRQCVTDQESVEAETRRWDESSGTTCVMRRKEGAGDYRFMTEPDLPPLTLSPTLLAAAQAGRTPNRTTTQGRYWAMGLNAEQAEAVLKTGQRRAAFEQLIKQDIAPALAARWVSGPASEWVEAGRDLQTLAEVLALVTAQTLSRSAAQTVLEACIAGREPPLVLATRLGLVQVNDADRLKQFVEETLSAHPDVVSAFQSGREQVLGFLVGKALARSRGAADPKALGRLLRSMMNERPR